MHAAAGGGGEIKFGAVGDNFDGFVVKDGDEFRGRFGERGDGQDPGVADFGAGKTKLHFAVAAQTVDLEATFLVSEDGLSVSERQEGKVKTEIPIMLAIIFRILFCGRRQADPR